MAELEIHHEGGHEPDSTGQKVGVLAAVLAVALALVTIASHRAHTEGVLLKTEANDQWSYYQSKRLKQHSLELGEDLISLLSSESEKTQKALQKYKAEKERYNHDAEEVQQEARKKESEVVHIEKRALRFDFGEGLLEIALVLSSLYFISRKLLFPAIGVIAGLIGAAIAVAGWMA